MARLHKTDFREVYVKFRVVAIKISLCYNVENVIK